MIIRLINALFFLLLSLNISVSNANEGKSDYYFDYEVYSKELMVKDRGVPKILRAQFVIRNNQAKLKITEGYDGDDDNSNGCFFSSPSYSNRDCLKNTVIALEGLVYDSDVESIYYKNTQCALVEDFLWWKQITMDTDNCRIMTFSKSEKFSDGLYDRTRNFSKVIIRLRN